MKKSILRTILLGLAYGLGSIAIAQTPASLPPTFIKGDMAIAYNTQSSDKPVPGVKDVYTLNINVDNSVLLVGEIDDTPQIIDGWSANL